jgi:TonB-dependent receptor
MKNLLRLLCALCALAATTHTARADDAPPPSALAIVTGRVLDADSNLYLKNAEVRLAGTNNIVYTEDGGAYRIEVPAGSVTLTVSYANLQTATRTLTATAGADNTADFELLPLLILDRRAAAAITSGTGAAAPGTPGAIDPNVILLDRFTVREERTGQAKVLMEQRAAENAKTILSTDQFGELTQDSVGEFMKYMPGITLDYDDEGEATSVRVGGLDPKYAGFAMDGITIASSGGSRANHFSQMSITAIESIEFNQTLLARMPANTPAGKFELKTRYAFNRKKPEISFDLGLDGTGNTIELGRAYLPDNKKHWRTYLGGRVSYGGVFLNRTLGIEASVSSYQNYRNDQRHEILYTYPVGPHINSDTGEYVNPNPDVTFVTNNGNLEAIDGPYIRRLSWLDGPRIWTKQSVTLKVDYKLSPSLTASFNGSFNYSETDYTNIYYQLEARNRDDGDTTNTDAPPYGHSAIHSLTYWEVDPSAPGTSNLALESTISESASSRVNCYTNYLFAPRLNYKQGPLQIDLRGGYSSALAKYRSADRGRFRGAANRLSGVGWIAKRDSTDSPTWYLEQTHGTLWTEAQNIGRANHYLMGVYYDDPDYNKNVQYSAYLDLTYAMRVFGHPVTFRAGGSFLQNDYTWRRNTTRFNYIGSEGEQLATTYPFADNYVFNMDLRGKAGNINEQNWPVVDQYKLWDYYQANKHWFIEDTEANTQADIVNRRDLTERIEGAYAEATTRAGKFSFNLGVRAERTSADILYNKMRTAAEISTAEVLARSSLGGYTPADIAAGRFNTGTVEGVKFQYYDGERGTKKVDYTNLFLSGGMKYDFTSSLRFQFSFSQAILRPDYDNLAGTINYPDYYPSSLWIPNPKLKPEKTIKYYAGLQYYLNPTGIIEVSAYRLDIKDMQIKNMQILKEDAEANLGYALDDILAGLGADSEMVIDEETQEEIEVIRANAPIVYRSTINAKGSARIVYGITLKYDQQLTFLPGVLKGLSIFGSFTTATLKNSETEEEEIGRASKAASGGIKYRLGRFNVQLRGGWDDDRLIGITRPYPDRRWMTTDHRYRKSRAYVDLSGGFRLNKNLEMVFSIRNLTGEPVIYYSNVPNRICWYSTPDTIWNLSIRGKY